jgi:hypothetical protein
MANSLSSSLVLDTVASRTINYLGNVFAPLSAFSTDFSNEEFTQLQNVRVPVATVGSTTQTNPTNWESGDSNIGNINVLVNQYSQSFQLSPRELNNGFRLEQLVDINIQNFGNKIMDAAFAPFTTTNFSNITVAQGSLVSANLKTVWAGIAKNPIKNCILDATAYAQFLPASLTTEIGPKPGLAGFDNFYLNTRWTGAGTNIYGFAGGKNAVAVVAGLPAQVGGAEFSGLGLEQRVVSITLGGRGTDQAPVGPTLPVLVSTWLSLATRTRWMSMDVMFGAAASGDTGSGYVFKSA